MKCPKCGSEDIDVKITAWARVSDGGAEVRGEPEWDEDSDAECADCGHEGVVGDFEEEAVEEAGEE
jgi:hypothetical protein